MIPLDPLLRILLDRENRQFPAATLKTAKPDNVVLLTRRLKAANPDAKHPGKAGE